MPGSVDMILSRQPDEPERMSIERAFKKPLPERTVLYKKPLAPGAGGYQQTKVTKTMPPPEQGHQMVSVTKTKPVERKFINKKPLSAPAERMKDLQRGWTP